MRIEFTKWDGRPHWHYEIDPIGDDEHGRWFAVPPGRRLHRVFDDLFTNTSGFVSLVPATGWWIASFNQPLERVDVYVDIATEPVYDGDVVRACDLDLDVIRWRDGRVVIDDEDEFEEHQVAMGYPDDVVAAARSTCDAVADLVRRRAGPFGDVADAWVAAAVRAWTPGR